LRDLRRWPRDRARRAYGCCCEAHRVRRRGEHVPGDLLYPDLLLDRRALELQEALDRRDRQACRRLRRQPVWLRDLGRAVDLLALLPRREAAARRLTQGMADMSEPNIKDELAKVEAEPLLPIEKKLIGWSLGIGVTLLIALAAVNYFLPAA